MSIFCAAAANPRFVMEVTMNTLVHDRCWPARRRQPRVSKTARAMALLGFLAFVAVAVNSAIIVADGLSRPAADVAAVVNVNTGGQT